MGNAIEWRWVTVHAVAQTETGTQMIMLCGVIDDDEATVIRAALVHAVWRRGPGEVIVEVSANVSMDDTLLGALVAASTVATGRGTSVRIRCHAAAIGERLAASGCALLAA